MQAFYFSVKFGLVLIYVLEVYRKKSSSILLRKICSIHYLHFSFEKILKDFSVENLESTPRYIYLKLLIMGIVF